MPDRIQLRRTKGWRMPPNTVSVARPTAFGNPFTVAGAIDAGVSDQDVSLFVVSCFGRWLDGDRSEWMGVESDAAAAEMLSRIPSLRGKNLACWCPLGLPCHADVLLEIANAP